MNRAGGGGGALGVSHQTTLHTGFTPWGREGMKNAPDSTREQVGHGVQGSASSGCGSSPEE